MIDGSSLDVHIAGVRAAVAYLGAEAPLPTHRCGQAALDRNRELVGTRVVLEADPAYEFDARGQRLYYAFTPDGVFIDAALVAEGLAQAVRTDAGRGAHLAALEEEARAAGRGCLWLTPGASQESGAASGGATAMGVDEG